MKVKRIRTTGLAAIRVFGMCLAALQVPACAYSEENAAGEPYLHFERATSTTLQLRLVNRSSQVIRFRGTRNNAAEAFPWDTFIECNAANSAYWDEGPFRLVDGEQRIVDLPPGQDVPVLVGAEFANQYKGGRCRVNLRLLGGSFVKSGSFVP